MFFSDKCLSWHKLYDHWWFGNCPNAGENMGYGYMDERVR